MRCGCMAAFACLVVVAPSCWAVFSFREVSGVPMLFENRANADVTIGRAVVAAWPSLKVPFSDKPRLLLQAARPRQGHVEPSIGAEKAGEPSAEIVSPKTSTKTENYKYNAGPSSDSPKEGCCLMRAADGEIGLPKSSNFEVGLLPQQPLLLLQKRATTVKPRTEHTLHALPSPLQAGHRADVPASGPRPHRVHTMHVLPAFLHAEHKTDVPKRGPRTQVSVPSAFLSSHWNATCSAFRSAGGAARLAMLNAASLIQSTNARILRVVDGAAHTNYEARIGARVPSSFIACCIQVAIGVMLFMMFSCLIINIAEYTLHLVKSAPAPIVLGDSDQHVVSAFEPLSREAMFAQRVSRQSSLDDIMREDAPYECLSDASGLSTERARQILRGGVGNYAMRHVLSNDGGSHKA